MLALPDCRAEHMNQAALTSLLASGLRELNLALDEPVRSQMIVFLELLTKWNQAYNLTAVRDPVQMVPRHLLDSLAIVPFLRGDRVVDVGSGAGLPGLPLAMACPDRQFVLIDSNGKKTRFLVQAVATLGLRNVEVVQTRVEDYRPVKPFATVISRAFASLVDFVRLTERLCATDGCWLAMKGEVPDAELSALPAGTRVTAVHPLKVPGLDAQRCVIEIMRNQE